ncbi:hypothetical protein O3M35_007688 [Rhynocoris fuscipes]|uniref:Secreted protein n=1 Tax=Rhynocoris fuscipes TaxID=488301 RepID=A0AAW1DAY4_9HEMI
MYFLKMAAYIILSNSCLIVIGNSEQTAQNTTEDEMLEELEQNSPDLGLILARLNAIAKVFEEKKRNQIKYKEETLSRVVKPRFGSKLPKFVFVCPKCKHKYRLYI